MEIGTNRRLTRHLRVTGLVQGVGYRAQFAAEAQRLGLGGWVRNCSDGSVEASVCGSMERVQQITEWARHGPRAAQVRSIRITDTEDIGCSPDFDVRPTR